MVALPSLAACLPMQIHTTSYPPTKPLEPNSYATGTVAMPGASP